MPTNAMENLGFLGLAILGVALGALIGWIVTGVAVWAVCKRVIGKQPPNAVSGLLRNLGAIAGLLVVASYLKFGGGSGYFFGSGGKGEGSAKGKETGSLGSSSAAATLKEEPEALKKVDAVPPIQPDRMRVTILGGDRVKGRAFYRLDDVADAVDLEKVRDAVRARQKAGKLTAVDVLIYQNSLGFNTDPVRQLKSWGAEIGLSMNPTEIQADLPE